MESNGASLPKIRQQRRSSGKQHEPDKLAESTRKKRSKVSPSASSRKEQVLLEYGAVIPDGKSTLLPSIKKAQPEPSLMRMLYEERTLELPSLISKEATGLGAWMPSPPKDMKEAGFNSIADQIARRYVGGLARLEEERRVWRQRDAARRHRGFRSPSPPKHRLQALAPLQPLSAREEPSKRLILPPEPLTAREVRFEGKKLSSSSSTTAQDRPEKDATKTSATNETLSRADSDEVLSDVQWIPSSKESSQADCIDDVEESSSFAKDLIGKLMTNAIIETMGPDEGKPLLAVQEDSLGPMQRVMLQQSHPASKKKEEVTFRRQRSSVSSSSDGRHEDPGTSSSVRRQEEIVSSSSLQRTRSSIVIGEAEFIRNLSKKRPTLARSLSMNRLSVNPAPTEKIRAQQVTADVPEPDTKPMPRKSVFDDCFTLARKYNFPLETIRTCMQDFKRYNVSESGTLNLKEFKEVVRDFCDIPKDEEVPIPIVQGVWKEVDTNVSDAVCFEEYVLWYMKSAFSSSLRLDPKERLIRSTAKRLDINVFQVEDVYKTFAAVDCNGNGLIDETEFRKAFFKLIGVSNDDAGISQNRMRQYWLEADANNNGGIGFEEFLTWYVRMGHSRRDLR